MEYQDKEYYKIEGGVCLSGRVRVSGAKNAVLPMLAAVTLTRAECIIHHVPSLRDVQVMTQILRLLGVKVEMVEAGLNGGLTLVTQADSLTTHVIKDNLSRQMRSSIFLMGPLLGRLGEVRIAYPGGCAIGPRPIDLHLRGLAAMGARITEKHGYILAQAARLHGADIHLDFPSVGATENLIMAAATAEGVTTLRNVAKEPEIVDLQNFLSGMGVRIRGAGTDTIRVEGVGRLGGTEHTVIPDRIEAGTFMASAAFSGGEVRVENVVPEHVESISAKLREAGVTVQEGRNWISVKGPRKLKAVDVKTLPYPGFPTDMLPQMMAIMTTADGSSIITETIFEQRFSQAEELRRMGANIRIEGRTAVVKGVPGLTGAEVEASDLRSGAALVLAGLVAEGTSCVEGVYHIDRGYENLEGKLRGLGAAITREKMQGAANRLDSGQLD